MLYIIENGCKWRALPKEYGEWHTIYVRFNRWCKNGTIDRIFEALQTQNIIDVLERDKKSQLLADYDVLVSYMDEYRFYWENDTSLVTNLNQVKNIKRNAMKDLRSYVEQIEGMLTAKKNPLKMQTASYKIGQLLDRFIHYKLALHVFALSEYMEVMLSKNFQAEYLTKIEGEIREHAC